MLFLRWLGMDHTTVPLLFVARTRIELFSRPSQTYGLRRAATELRSRPPRVHLCFGRFQLQGDPPPWVAGLVKVWSDCGYIRCIEKYSKYQHIVNHAIARNPSTPSSPSSLTTVAVSVFPCLSVCLSRWNAVGTRTMRPISPRATDKRGWGGSHVFT